MTAVQVETADSDNDVPEGHAHHNPNGMTPVDMIAKSQRWPLRTREQGAVMISILN
jgi:hypothetical protein